jgi:hypothetical protein
MSNIKSQKANANQIIFVILNEVKNLIRASFFAFMRPFASLMVTTFKRFFQNVSSLSANDLFSFQFLQNY